MKVFKDTQTIDQLEKRKGGYFYVTVPAEAGQKLKSQGHTRFICVIDKKFTLHCGLNHTGNGDFFILLGSKTLKSIQKKKGDTIRFELRPDPDPLGVPVPEVLQALLEQDDTLKAGYEKLTPGKKRALIFAITKIKDVDKQVSNAYKLISLLSKPGMGRSRKP